MHCILYVLTNNIYYVAIEQEIFYPNNSYIRPHIKLDGEEIEELYEDFT